MRIISKHRDYYDVALSYGIDKELVFVRNTVEHKCTTNESFVEGRVTYATSGFFNLTTSKILIFFCGKMYPCFRISTTKDFKTINHDFYDEQTLAKYLEKTLSKKEYRKYIEHKEHIPRWMRRWQYGTSSKVLTSQQRIEEYFNDIDHSIAETYCTDNKVAYVVFEASYLNREHTATTLPVLRDYEFYKAVHPQLAFQEISMYISGVLGTGNPDMIEIEDKYRIEGHGFDKFSFRHKNPKGRT